MPYLKKNLTENNWNYHSPWSGLSVERNVTEVGAWDSLSVDWKSEADWLKLFEWA